jgi:dCTP deaminase
MILSAQSIRARCEMATPMITPFVAEKTVLRGKSYGLSACSYDVRIAHDCELGPLHGGDTIYNDPIRGIVMNRLSHYALAHTVEDFHMPDDVCGTVVDKSSYARVFVSAFNTLIDSGFVGNLTLELVNLSNEPVFIEAGSPICQIMFHQLDKPTERPYGPKDKYYGQTKTAHPARYEEN